MWQQTSVYCDHAGHMLVLPKETVAALNVLYAYMNIYQHGFVINFGNYNIFDQYCISSLP